MISKILGWGAVVIGALAGAWVTSMWYDDAPPYVYSGADSFITPNPAIGGKDVTVNWHIATIHRICPGSVQRFFSNPLTGEVITTLDTTEISRAVKKHDTHLPRTFVLPTGLPEHVAYSAEACFRCNLLQYVFPLCYMTPSIVFHVAQP